MERSSKEYPQYQLAPENLDLLIQALKQRGYQVVGPKVSEGAIVYDEIHSSDELPIGWSDKQEAGYYRLKRRADKAYFGYVVGSHSWKRFLHPPALRLVRLSRNGKGFSALDETPKPPKRAFLGVRGCELKAIAIQDKVFLEGTFIDPYYQAHRENLFIVAVNCTQAGKTCFCTSMKTGPKVTSGYDLALTEILSPSHHQFLLEIGSPKGAEVASDLPLEGAPVSLIQEAEARIQQTATQMGRTLDTRDIKDLLYGNLENPQWEKVAQRCLTCANCTMVCPTCFCTTVEEVTDLTGDHVERWRKWDSCFTMDFSYIHGGSIRASTQARYRQWLTHKLATWIDQFGTSGCVGCGRCITWCPVGIDITQEVAEIRATDLRKQNQG